MLLKEYLKLLIQTEIKTTLQEQDSLNDPNVLVKNNPMFPVDDFSPIDDNPPPPEEQQSLPEEEPPTQEENDPVETLWNDINELYKTNKNQNDLLKFAKSNIQSNFNDFNEAIPFIDKLLNSNIMPLKNVGKSLKQFVEIDI